MRDGTSGLLTDRDAASLGDVMARVLGDDALRARLGEGEGATPTSSGGAPGLWSEPMASEAAS